jgi:xylan 1,4-beta-xylosidase
VNLQGSVTWAFEFENQPIFAGFRELATGGMSNGVDYLVDKPVLNVFRMMGMMGGDAVSVTSSGALPVEQVVKESVRAAPDVNAIATRSQHRVDVLLWNYHDDDVAAESAKVLLAVKNIPIRGVRVQRFLMDGQHSNAYAAWQKMGSPQQPTTEQFLDLQRAGKLETVGPATTLATKNGRAEVDLTLERQAVMLVRLSW